MSSEKEPVEKQSIADRAKAVITAIRERWPIVDHVLRMVEHYGQVRGSLQAGAVTYFAFLSFFPVLALAFFVIGKVKSVYPNAEDQTITAINSILPGMVGDGEGQISLDSIAENASTIGWIGLFGVLFAGLGWLSGMRKALLTVFDVDKDDSPNFILGKGRDLVTLALIGLTMVLSVAVSGVVTGLSKDILGWVGLSDTLSPLLSLLALVLGIGANMVLFFALFKLLAAPPLPVKSLWQGALLGALGFEVLKQLSSFLLRSTKDQPAFQAFGIALILVVWINYFSRVVMYSAAWAHTTEEARRLRGELEAPPEPPPPEYVTKPPVTKFGAGALTGAAAAAAALNVRRQARKREDEQ